MPKFYNKTRESNSIPSKLLREGKFYLVPFYYLLLTSELAKEGIKNSGSYRFADHIYGNKAKGRFGIGKLIDMLLLRLISARSLRARYVHAKKEIHNFVSEKDHQSKINVLAVPSGLAREIFEVADELKLSKPSVLNQINWHGIDLDSELINSLNQKKASSGHNMVFIQGDALNPSSYINQGNYDMILSMGFVDFLDDPEAQNFYNIVYDRLNDGGIFYTSAMQPHKFSEYLMKTFAELKTRYRSESKLRAMASHAGFNDIITYQDGLQTIIIARKDNNGNT